MSLYTLPKELLIEIIKKTERPKYIIKVLKVSDGIYDGIKLKIIDVIGPFYTEEECFQYLEDKDNMYWCEYGNNENYTYQISMLHV